MCVLCVHAFTSRQTFQHHMSLMHTLILMHIFCTFVYTNTQAHPLHTEEPPLLILLLPVATQELPLLLNRMQLQVCIVCVCLHTLTHILFNTVLPPCLRRSPPGAQSFIDTHLYLISHITCPFCRWICCCLPCVRRSPTRRTMQFQLTLLVFVMLLQVDTLLLLLHTALPHQVPPLLTALPLPKEARCLSESAALRHKC